MTEMVERVARALFEAEYPGGEADEYRWERSADAYRDQARAAIESMREPTETMARAALFSNPYVPRDGLIEIEHWKIMIDAALKD